MKPCVGENIRRLRHAKHVSQEKLAEMLNVSFQAVSKWENGISLPDVALFPAIAEYFGVSTDELFGIDRMQREERIATIFKEAAQCRDAEPARAEAILREALRRWPGDEILLNNLLYTIRAPERRGEVVDLCRLLVENCVRYDDVRLDAWRIMAETYHDMGEYALARQALEHIPEIYFTRLELEAELLQGEDALIAARKQRNLSAELMIRMLRREGALSREMGDERAARTCRQRVDAILSAVGELPHPFKGGSLKENLDRT